MYVPNAVAEHERWDPLTPLCARLVASVYVGLGLFSLAFIVSDDDRLDRNLRPMAWAFVGLMVVIHWARYRLSESQRKASCRACAADKAVQAEPIFGEASTVSAVEPRAPTVLNYCTPARFSEREDYAGMWCLPDSGSAREALWWAAIFQITVLMVLVAAEQSSDAVGWWLSIMLYWVLALLTVFRRGRQVDATDILLIVVGPFLCFAIVSIFMPSY
jgi:hypothetical protein